MWSRRPKVTSCKIVHPCHTSYLEHPSPKQPSIQVLLGQDPTQCRSTNTNVLPANVIPKRFRSSQTQRLRRVLIATALLNESSLHRQSPSKVAAGMPMAMAMLSLRVRASRVIRRQMRALLRQRASRLVDQRAAQRLSRHLRHQHLRRLRAAVLPISSQPK